MINSDLLGATHGSLAHAPRRSNARPDSGMLNPMPIHVATWNVWWRFGDWAARRPAIVETLRRAEPDILCIQEA